MMLATKLIGGFVIVAVLEEFVERIKSWCHPGFVGEEIPYIAAAVHVGLYMARSPASTTRLQTDPGDGPKLRYLAKGYP
jgi:hypothetical protein